MFQFFLMNAFTLPLGMALVLFCVERRTAKAAVRVSSVQK